MIPALIFLMYDGRRSIAYRYSKRSEGTKDIYDEMKKLFGLHVFYKNIQLCEDYIRCIVSSDTHLSNIHASTVYVKNYSLVNAPEPTNGYAN